ncbi:hypothetical protein [Parvibaculum sp.]|uniref:hypothetical protein n=1 Tax=Parvibaculum sp. TaxID=2024848 RepID=UPI000C8D1D75|nr:hypothetical protein [Parvibaculum sp.]MAB15353.1 hypothetical protein [Parvibaculum sp.]
MGQFLLEYGPWLNLVGLVTDLAGVILLGFELWIAFEADWRLGKAEHLHGRLSDGRDVRLQAWRVMAQRARTPAERLQAVERGLELGLARYGDQLLVKRLYEQLKDTPLAGRIDARLKDARAGLLKRFGIEDPGTVDPENEFDLLLAGLEAEIEDARRPPISHWIRRGWAVRVGIFLVVVGAILQLLGSLPHQMLTGG